MYQEWKNQTLPRSLEYAAKNWPENIAIRSGDEAITFTALQNRVQHTSLALHNLGVQRGDHVAYMMSVCTQWVEIFFATLALGAKLVPLNITWVGDEIRQGLQLTDAKYLLIGAEHRGENLVNKFTDALPELSQFTAGQCQIEGLALETVITTGEIDSAPPFAIQLKQLLEQTENATWPPQQYVPPTANDCALLLLTSGTTAFPKPVMHTHETMLCGIYGYADGVEATDADTFLHTTPNYHVGGIITMCIPILRGGTARLMNWFDPELAMQLIESDPVTLFWGFDTHYAMMRNHPSYGQYDLSSITRTLSGSNPATFDAIHGMGFKHVGSLYGMSESMGCSSFFPYRDRFDFERMKQSNGRTNTGEIRIISQETGKQVPIGEPGEICVKGPSLFKGYYNMPEQTQVCFDEDGFFHSGDYGWVDADDYLYYRGRYKEIIKTGGENVSMLEVEMFLMSAIPGVQKAVICGTPDEKWGEAIAALIEVDPTFDLTEEQVREACRGRLAGYKIPKRVFFVNNKIWKITPTGKLDRTSARNTALALIEATTN